MGQLQAPGLPVPGQSGGDGWHQGARGGQRRRSRWGDARPRRSKVSARSNGQLGEIFGKDTLLWHVRICAVGRSAAKRRAQAMLKGVLVLVLGRAEQLPGGARTLHSEWPPRA